MAENGLTSLGIDPTMGRLGALPVDIGPRHFCGAYGAGGEFHLWRTPAPDYRAGDRCDYAALAGAMQFRPLMLSDMIPGLAYRPGSMLFSRHFPQLGVTSRIVAPVAPEYRADSKAALKMLLAAQDAAGRPHLRNFLTSLARAVLAAPDSWDTAPADVEQSTVATMTL